MDAELELDFKLGNGADTVPVSVTNPISVLEQNYAPEYGAYWTLALTGLESAPLQLVPNVARRNKARLRGNCDVVAGPSSALAAPVLAAPTTNPAGGTLPDGTYFYELTAFNSFGETIASLPRSVTAAGGGASQNTITWTGVLGATGYRIYRSATSNGPYSFLQITPGAASYVDTGAIAPTAGVNPPAFNGSAVPTPYALVGTQGAVSNGQGYRLWAGTALEIENMNDVWVMMPKGIVQAFQIAVLDEQYRR